MASRSTVLSPPFEHLGEPAPTLRRGTNYGQWVAVAVLALITGLVAYSLYGNENLDVPTVRHYLFDRTVLLGVVTTIELTAICFALGMAGGLVFAIMRLSANRVLSTISAVFVWIFRSIPPLVQLIFWGFFAALYPRIEIGIPFTDIHFISRDTNSVMSPFVAAIIGLTLIEIAYMAEVIRGGLAGVDEGQRLAARALGMTRGLTLRKIVLPQAMPSIIPALGNNLVDLIKGTSLVSVIGGAELMTRVQHIYSQNFEVIPLLVVAAIWYLVITGVLSLVLNAIERHYSRGTAAQRIQQPAKPASSVAL